MSEIILISRPASIFIDIEVFQHDVYNFTQTTYSPPALFLPLKRRRSVRTACFSISSYEAGDDLSGKIVPLTRKSAYRKRG